MIVAVCAACGGQSVANGIHGNAFLLGETDHSGTHVSVVQDTGVVAEGLTDKSGAYHIEAPAGAFDLRFEHDGYPEVVQPDVVILQNDVGVPDVTLRRGVLLDSAPILTAQPVGSSQVLVQFDHGDDSPTHLVDFTAGTARKVAAGAMVLRDSNERFATVEMDRLYRLDLTTAALDAVTPSAGNSGFAAGGYTFYVAVDGTLSALRTGDQQALALGFTTCRSAVVLAAAQVPAAPGWFSITIPAGCSQTSTSFVLVNPRLQVARGPYSSLHAASGNLFLREPDGGNPSSPTSSLRKVDPTTGTETTAIAAVRIVQAINGDPTLLLVGSPTSPGSFNVDLKLVDVVRGTVVDAATNVSSGGTSFLSEDFRQTGLFVGSTLIRYDTRTVTPLCASPLMVSGPTMLFNGTGHPLGFLCSTGSTIRTYEWASDRVRDLASAATSAPAFTGRIATWNEGSALRAARIGEGDPTVTLCASATLSGTSLVTSADGSAAALSCPDAGDATGKLIAVDLRTGASDTLVAAKPGSGSHISVISMAVSAAGRGVILDYTTTAGASDPANCGSSECTLVIDRRNGTRAFANPAIGFFNATSSPDDRGFAINGSAGPLIAVFGAAAPAFASTPASGLLLGIGGDGRHALVGQGGLRGPYSLVDLVSGAAIPVTAPSISATGSPIQLGTTNDFVVAEGVAHVDTGVIESLGQSATPICGVFGSRFAFLDGTGTLLEEYAAGSGVRTLAGGVLDLNLGTCTDVRRLFLGGFDGRTGSLLGYAPKTGAVTELAADVSSHIGASGSRMFAFQHPDSVSGDLLLLGSTGTLPLGARAHLGTTFTVAGSRVAFTGGTANEEPKLTAAKLDGSGARTVGPAADRVLFSPDGTRLLFNSGGLLWSEDPSGPAVALGETGTMDQVVLNGTGDVLLYSVSSGEHRGTYRVDLRRNADVPPRETTALAWAVTSL
ncbi:MAG: carboxypeptidase-like regulatory domain-containing protein [Myxococcales bacterium]